MAVALVILGALVAALAIVFATMWQDRWRARNKRRTILMQARIDAYYEALLIGEHLGRRARVILPMISAGPAPELDPLDEPHLDAITARVRTVGSGDVVA